MQNSTNSRATLSHRARPSGFRLWVGVMSALLIKEIWRHGRTRWTLFTFALLVLEPIGVIAAFGAIAYLLVRQPPYGNSTLLFHSTGIIPFYYFVRVSQRTRSFEMSKRNRMPCIDPLDEFLVVCLMDFIVMSAGTLVIFAGLAYFVTPRALPFDPLPCILSIFFTSIMACGINLFNAALINFSKAWVTVLVIAMRGLMLISGVVFVVDFMPSGVRYWLTLNPLTHSIMWFRTGVYPHYPAHSLDRSFLVEVALISLFVGVIVERAIKTAEGRHDHS